MLSVEHTLQMLAAETGDYDRLIYCSKYIYFFVQYIAIPQAGIAQSV